MSKAYDWASGTNAAESTDPIRQFGNRAADLAGAGLGEVYNGPANLLTGAHPNQLTATSKAQIAEAPNAWGMQAADKLRDAGNNLGSAALPGAVAGASLGAASLGRLVPSAMRSPMVAAAPGVAASGVSRAARTAAPWAVGGAAASIATDSGAGQALGRTARGGYDYARQALGYAPAAQPGSVQSQPGPQQTQSVSAPAGNGAADPMRMLGDWFGSLSGGQQAALGAGLPLGLMLLASKIGVLPTLLGALGLGGAGYGLMGGKFPGLGASAASSEAGARSAPPTPQGADPLGSLDQAIDAYGGDAGALGDLAAARYGAPGRMLARGYNWASPEGSRQYVHDQAINELVERTKMTRPTAERFWAERAAAREQDRAAQARMRQTAQ